ncbi:hypothetical protein EII34_12890 [Arachnia propionica]|uniref:Uncharacterized protein n=1 Tax=Arachnia propionica TaxID=1750 RepID=A0A3P1T375_9ACTN|nr:DUF6767 domain-containing protein [Arachnia propionica]RRD03748.1 hypothetical protein EII34_12890 [Arachnia propionica]
MCPLRPGTPCSLCVPGADGPHNCQTVRLVMDDPELRQLWQEQRVNARKQRASVPSRPDNGHEVRRPRA